MTHTELLELGPAQRAEWLSDHSPLRNWSVGDDVFCFHCDGIWKAEDVACNDHGEPTCPVCLKGGPVGLFHSPWWRDDLVAERFGVSRYEWAGRTLRAEPGNPRRVPAPIGGLVFSC
jgi:hypothetical protein